MSPEWLVPESVETTEDQVLYLRHLRAYDYARMWTRKKVVLEIGCGAGYGGPIFAPDAAYACAIDRSFSALSSCRLRNSTFLDLALADAAYLPFKEQTFDVVLLFQVLEHIPPDHLKPFLTNIARPLKPGGKLVLTTPNRKTRLLPLQPPANPYHTQEFSRRTLEKALLGCSAFEEIRIFGITARDEVKQIELSRTKLWRKPLYWYVVRPLKRWAKRVLPAPLLRSLTRRLQREARDRSRGSPLSSMPEGRRDSKPSISLDDFYVVDTKLDGSLDLLTVCTRKHA